MTKRKDSVNTVEPKGTTPRKGDKKKQTKATGKSKKDQTNAEIQEANEAKKAMTAENPGTKNTQDATPNSKKANSPPVGTNNHNEKNYSEHEGDPLKQKNYNMATGAATTQQANPPIVKRSISEQRAELLALVQNNSATQSSPNRNQSPKHNPDNSEQRRRSTRLKTTSIVSETEKTTKIQKNKKNQTHKQKEDERIKEVQAHIARLEAELKLQQATEDAEVDSDDSVSNDSESEENDNRNDTDDKSNNSDEDTNSSSIASPNLNLDDYDPDDDDTAELLEATRKSMQSNKIQERLKNTATITPASKTTTTKEQGSEISSIDISEESDSENEMELDEQEQEVYNEMDESAMEPKILDDILAQDTHTNKKKIKKVQIAENQKDDKQQTQQEEEETDDEEQQDNDGFTKVLPKKKKTTQTKIPTDIASYADIRFGFMVKIPSAEEPLKLFSEKMKQVFKFLQTQIHKNLYIGCWNPKDQSQNIPLWEKPKDIPNGGIGDRMQLFNFFGKIVNPKRQQEDKLFLQIRLVTPTPNDLPIPLQDIGKEFSELIEEKFQVKIFRNPYACQAAKTATIGWLWGSTKTMPDDKLMPAIRKQLGIPKEVAAGLQWRTIKEVTGRNYKWGENDAPPPQALHFDMDDDYAPLYAEKAAKFWRKHAKQKILGLHLRLVPCFGSAQAMAMDDCHRENTMLLAQKQLFFINSYVTTINTPHIQTLDTPLSSENDMTLRRYIMSVPPEGFITQRLFVNIDKSWKQGNDYIGTTPKKYVDQARRTLNNMIPACLAKYGQGAEKWFTTTGLLVYKDVQFDTQTGTTTSKQAEETEKLVNEQDIFGMGEIWKESLDPTAQDSSRPTDTPPANTPNDTMSKILQSRALSNDIQSLGSVYNRNKDDDTIATHASKNNMNSFQPATDTLVEFDVTNMEISTQKNSQQSMNHSMGMSTAGQTTGTTRLKVKELEQLNKQLQLENQQLYEAQLEESSVITSHTTKTTKAKLSAAEIELQELKTQMAEQAKLLQSFAQLQQAGKLVVATPSPPAGAVSDGIGKGD